MNARPTSPRLQLLAALLLVGCGTREQAPTTDSPASVAAASVADAPVVVVDSALPREEEMRRFTRGLTEPTALAGGAPSADALVARFVRALETRDTAALRDLRIDRAEFAYLYYPTAKLATPPYDLPPGLMWFQLEGNSGRGLLHALEERGGRPLSVVGHRCDRAEREGENRVHGGCVVRRVQAPGDTVHEPLFGGIVERGGVFKFVSYANKL